MKKADFQFIQEGVRKLGAVRALFEHMQSAYIEAVSNVFKGFLAGTTTPVVIHGVVNSGSGSNYNISGGAIWHNGEMFLIGDFNATAPGGQVPVLILVETKTPLAYTDNTNRDTLIARVYGWQFAASGSGLGDFSALGRLASIINDTLLDVDGQISNAVASKAPLASPALTGTPTAPTAVPGTNNTQIANTAFVQAVKNEILNGAGAAFDTLLELAAALGNDPNFATTMANALALKAPLASPALTGTPTAPTAAPGTNNTQIATTAFAAAIAALKSDKAQPAWINLSVINGWTDSGVVQLRYRVTDQNKLEVAGFISTGSASSPVFANLPGGLVPGSHDMSIAVANNTDHTGAQAHVVGGSPTTLQLVGYTAGKTYGIFFSVALDSAS